MPEQSTGNTNLKDALYWLDVSRLQITRFVDNLLVAAENTHKENFALAATADAHFLLNAFAQVEKCLQNTAQALPANRSLQVRCLRNLYEHWEQHKATFASQKIAKRKAGKSLAGTYPDVIPWNFKIDATGTWISILKLEEVWIELNILEKSLLELQDLKKEVADKPFPRRNSKVLGFSMLTQNIILDFD